MYNFESYEINFKGKTYSGKLANRVGKYLFYKSIKHPRLTLFTNGLNIVKKIN